MSEPPKVEIDIERYQEGIMRMAAGLRDLQPAFDQLNESMKELNRALTLLLQATKPRSMTDPNGDNDESR